MKVRVVKKFKDKYDKSKIYKKNAVLDITEERYEEIQKKGNYVVPVNEESLATSQPETPAEESEVPVEEPETPAEESEVPVEEPETPIEESEVPVEEPEVPVEDAEDGELESLSIQELRKIAKEMDISAAGSKAEIIERIKENA